MSKLPRKSRKNKLVLITGMTGSGKSRMGERLSDPWPRIIYVDPTDSFIEEEELSTNVFKTYSYDEFVTVWKGVFNEPEWRIAAIFVNEADYARLFESLWLVIANKDFPQEHGFLLVVDEADMFSDPNDIDENLRHLAKRGRHFGISLVVICQFDTDTNKTFRGNAGEAMIFVQGMLSPEMLRKLKGAAKIRAKRGQPELVEVEELTEHDSEGDAIENVNFIACPDDWETFMVKWDRLAEQQRGEYAPN